MFVDLCFLCFFCALHKIDLRLWFVKDVFRLFSFLFFFLALAACPIWDALITRIPADEEPICGNTAL